MKRIVICTMLVILIPTLSQAADLGISFSDEAAEVVVSQELGYYDSGASVLNLGGIYNENKDTALLLAGLDVKGPLAKTGIELGVGVKVYYGNSDDLDIAAGGLGAMIRFIPSALPQASFGGIIYYCPEILSSMDSKKLVETGLNASFEIAPNATVFASYTNIEVEIENGGDRTIDTGFRLGLTLGF